MGSDVPIHPQTEVCAPSADFGGDNSTGLGRGSCEVGEVCRFYGENPLYGTMSFDSIIGAWMTIFQCITLEGWVDVLYLVQVRQQRNGGVTAGACMTSNGVTGHKQQCLLTASS